VRARLVVEASRLYAAGGYAGLSFGTLARRVGIMKATVFHYFASKDALVWAIFEGLGRRLEERARVWFEPPPRSHAARLERLVGGLVDFYGAEPVNAGVVCQGLLGVERVGAAPPALAEFVRRFVAFVESGIAAREFRPDRPLGTVMSIGGVVLFHFMVPAAARRLAGGAADVALSERRREVVAFVRRAVVRPSGRVRARRTLR
jgi:AcrR family transcriptional regulator